MMNVFNFKGCSEDKILFICSKEKLRSELSDMPLHKNELLITISKEKESEFDSSHFCFDDVEEGEGLITKEQALDLKIELDRALPIKNSFIISCDGGVSRSASVGLAFMIATGNRDVAEQMLNCNKFSFNHAVAKSLLHFEKDIEFLDSIIRRNREMPFEEEK